MRSGARSRVGFSPRREDYWVGYFQDKIDTRDKKSVYGRVLSGIRRVQCTISRCDDLLCYECFVCLDNLYCEWFVMMVIYMGWFLIYFSCLFCAIDTHFPRWGRRLSLHRLQVDLNHIATRLFWWILLTFRSFGRFRLTIRTGAVAIISTRVTGVFFAFCS